MLTCNRLLKLFDLKLFITHTIKICYCVIKRYEYVEMIRFMAPYGVTTYFTVVASKIKMWEIDRALKQMMREADESHNFLEGCQILILRGRKFISSNVSCYN